MFLYKTVGFCIFISIANGKTNLQDCVVSELPGHILGCSYDGHEVVVGDVARDGTECVLEVPEGTRFLLCRSGTWSQQSSIEDNTGGYVRKKRFFRARFRVRVRFRFRRFVRQVFVPYVRAHWCAVTLFSCLWPRPGGYTGGHIVYIVDKTKPSLECPKPLPVTASPLQLYQTVRWQEPTAVDLIDGNIKPTRIGKRPGSIFPENTTVITYVAKDRSGNEARCNVTVTVNVIRCTPPKRLDNGYQICHLSTDFVLGSRCRFGCYEGYAMRAGSSSEITCDRKGSTSGTAPICDPVVCPTVPTIARAIYNCTDDKNFKSVCWYKCDDGYDMPPEVSKTIVCTKYGTWRGSGRQVCVDVEPPVLHDCPTTLVAGTGVASNVSTVTWKSPIATDNSGESINVSQRSGPEPESELYAGKYTVVYGANDSSGNEARPCSFDIVVRDVKCPKLYPTPYSRIDCPNGYRTGFYCNITCDAGKTMFGSDFVVCDKSRHGLFGAWNWRGGTQSICKNTNNCVPITPPTNGAIACDNWSSGKFCQALCQKGTDMAYSTLDKLYTCGHDGSWWPTPKLGSCKAVQALFSRRLLFSAHFYYEGQCTSDSAQKQIANNFIVALENNFFTTMECNLNPGCSAENIQIFCGEQTLRKRRSADNESMELTIDWHILLPVTEETLDYEWLRTLMTNFELFVADSTEDVFAGVNVTFIDVTSGGISTLCQIGYVVTQQKTACIPCSEGTFYSTDGATEPECIVCPKGSYQPLTGQIACEQCPPGQTTRHTAASAANFCEDACAAGSYSPDGLPPCSPCPTGSYQDTFGQTSCRECPGSQTTELEGATTVSQCQEFDFVFPAGVVGKIAHRLWEPRPVAGLTLSVWVQVRSALHGIVISLLNSELIPVWSLTNFRDVTVADSVSVTVSTSLGDTLWHQIIVTTVGCDVRATMDGQSLVVSESNSSSGCLDDAIHAITVDSDLETDMTLSQLNMWSIEQPVTLDRRCNAGVNGDVIGWKELEDADIDGAFIQAPSVCDEVDDCLPNPCVHGTCIDDLSTFTCQCEQGFTGATCDVNIDDCHAHVCLNDAMCVDGVQGYTCACTEHFTGEYCETAVVDGGWGAWGNWSLCSATCGKSLQHRERRCDNPHPANGGAVCSGGDTETRFCNVTDCPVCEKFVEPDNSTATCTNNTSTDTVTCTIECHDGFDFDIAPMDEYTCGPETFHEWNFRTSFNPDMRLPNCVPIALPKNMTVWYRARYLDLFCSGDSFNQLAKAEIKQRVEQTVARLPCVERGSCHVSALTVTECDVASRRRRSEDLAMGFQLSLSTQPVDDTANETLTDYELSFKDLQFAVDEGNLTADILEDFYVIDVNQTDVEGKVVCGEGETQVHFYCVPCGPGTYLDSGDSQCHFCSFDYFQDVEGQAACKPCPAGQHTRGEGAISVHQCIGEADSEVNTALNVIAIVCGCVGAILLVVIIWIVFRKYHSVTKNKRKVGVHTESIWRIYTDGKLGPSNPKFNPPAAGFKTETLDDSSQPSHSEDCHSSTSDDFTTLEPWQLYNEGKLGPSNSKFAADLKSDILDDSSQLSNFDVRTRSCDSHTLDHDGGRGITRVGITAPSPDELRGPSRIELRVETPVDCI